MTGGCEWRHAPEACAGDSGRFEKSQLMEFLPPKKKVDFRSSPRPLRWLLHVVVVGGGKCLLRKIVYLSPYVEKTFNSKVIKRFVPELRSRKFFCFFCVLGFLCYLYISYEHSMYISHIHVWQCKNIIDDCGPWTGPRCPLPPNKRWHKTASDGFLRGVDYLFIIINPSFTQTRVAVPDTVPSMGQIDLFEDNTIK